jgi:hypothetical protein
MGAADIARGLGQAPVPGQGQPLRGLGQTDLAHYAAPAAAADQHGLEHGFAGHQRPRHIGKQAGGRAVLCTRPASA